MGLAYQGFENIIKSMKKTIIALMLALAVLFPAAAVWEFGNGFSFSAAPIDPLFKESRANPFSNRTAFSLLKSPEDGDYLPHTFLVSDPDMNGGMGGYREIPFEDLDTGHNSFWHLKAAMNLGLLRFSYKDYADIEMYIHGGLNTVFGNYGGTNALGFDGMYGVGFDLQLFDSFVFRFGFHHFSGHWGDEMMKKFYDRNPGWEATSDPAVSRELLEYTRNNSYFFDVSYAPVKYFRVLLEAELPMGKAWIRPSAHIPQDTVTPGYGDSQAEHNSSQEGVHRTEAYPASYRGWRIGIGAEAQYPIDMLGNVFISYDLQLHQDGKINLETLKYEEDRPWEIEHTVAFGFEFEEKPQMPSFSIECAYHDGRFPLLNYFFQRSRYFSVILGASF